MKLYFSPGTCSLASDIALREAGVRFELVRTDLRAKKTATGGDYLAINPKGYVPALELPDGSVLTENAALLEYIGDLNSAAGLAPPAGTMERYRLKEWLAFVNSEIHKSFSPFFNPATPDAYKEIARGNLTRRLGYVESVLKSRRFLMGEAFTVADAYLYTVLRWSGKASLDLNQWPASKRYMDEIAHRPHVREALRAETQP